MPITEIPRWRFLITACRMLSLITGRLFNMPRMAAQENVVLSDQRSDAAGKTTPIDDGLRLSESGIVMSRSLPNLLFHPGETDPGADRHAFRFWNTRILATKLFQLTEWVYQTTLPAQSDLQAARGEIGSWYLRCLDWYADLCNLVASDEGRTPFVLFIQ